MIGAVLAALALAAPTYGPDEIRYDVDVTHTKRELRGTERITFHNPFDTPLTHVWIRKWDGAYRKCDPGCTKQRIALDPPVAPDAEGTVEVPVALRVPGRFDRYGSHGPIDIFGNGLPILAVSENGAEPRLPPYTFRGESFFSLTAAWRVDLTLRPGERVAGTGRQTARTGNTVTLEAPAERDFTIAAGPMDVASTSAGGVRVRWFSRRDARPAQRRAGLRMTARSLAAQQRKLGSYGARELDALQTPASIGAGAVAMEYPQFILSPPYRYAVNHEVTHQWFYRLVGNDEYRDPWVDETLTSFAATRLGTRLNGSYLAGCARRHVQRRPALPVDSSMAVFDRRGRIGQTLYRAAPCILFNLQRRIGEGRMDRFLRALVRTYRGGVLTTPQLTRAIAALPTGRRTLRELRVRAGADR